MIITSLGGCGEGVIVLQLKLMPEKKDKYLDDDLVPLIIKIEDVEFPYFHIVLKGRIIHGGIDGDNTIYDHTVSNYWIYTLLTKEEAAAYMI